jgi:DNA repair exonuclease SbcCD nuclease subunit
MPATVLPVEKNNEKAILYGIGNMPEEHIEEEITNILKKHPIEKSAINLLVIHQSIKEFAAGQGLATETLASMPFDLVINGHIHQTIIKPNDKLVIPGSTVITQLKKEEIAPKGYILYDTATRFSEFIPIKSRPFFYEELSFDGVSVLEIRNAVDAKIAELRKRADNAIIRIRIMGTAKNDSDGSGLSFDHENVYVENELAGSSLKEKLEQIKKMKYGGAVHGYGEKMLIERTKDRIKGFDVVEMFERLQISPDEGFAYLTERMKTSSNAK